MFGMAGETEFDVRFSVFGIPVRVHPIFCLSVGLSVCLSVCLSACLFVCP